MKENRTVSAVKKGMNRTTEMSSLQNIEYTFAMNADTTNEQEGFNIQNEPSNHLGVQFPSGFKVIGFRNDILTNRTFYVLTDPLTGKSTIGFVENTVEDFFNQDQEAECEDCTQYNQLGEALEDTTQTASLFYQELFNDFCHIDNGGLGLNLSVDFPLKKIEIKQEKLGTKLYWDDNRNPPRHLNVSDTSYLFTQEVACQEDIQTDCILLDKLLVFPKHSRLIIEAKSLELGGNLKRGTYEFYGCYSDLAGNEMTQYTTPTNPISIFDENNLILEDTDAFTNFAIKLKIKNLDTVNFKYYKIVCVERNNVDNTKSGFVEGIYPTTNDEVVYTHSGSHSDGRITTGNISIKERIDLNRINQVKVHYDKAESTMVSGGKLWHKGLTKKEELNLQPVVNLFGSLLQWQTTIAKKDLYKDAIATSKYKAYMRNEVQPYAIRVFTKDGDYSSNFPLIGRPANDYDLNVISDMNFDSLNANAPKCGTDERDKRWQIFNTATFTADCNELGEGIESPEVEVKNCKITDVFTIPANFTVIDIEEEFIDLKSYVNDNLTINIPEITPALETEYPDHCTPSFSSVCGDLTLLEDYNTIGEVVNETLEFTPKEIGEYIPSLPPEYCQEFKKDNLTGAYVRDTEFENQYSKCYPNGAFNFERFKVYFRDSNFYNEGCNYATEVVDNTTTGESIFLNYAGALTIAELLQTQDVYATDTNFSNKLHKKAQFFKIKKNGRNKLIFEVTKNSSCVNTEDTGGYGGVLRYTIYKGCNNFEVIGGGIFLTSQGIITEIDTSTFSGETAIVAIDAPLVYMQAEDGNCDASLRDVYRLVPPCGCFSVFTRDIENKSVKVSWDSIRIDKFESYESLCLYRLPQVDECEPKAYKRGEFGYVESTERYPDNEQLYNSKNLKITTIDLEGLSEEDRIRFKKFYVQSTNTDLSYTLKEDTNFVCANIRHFKMPDNIVSPFMYDKDSLKKNADTIIFPLGITLDSAVVRTMLKVAVNNGLLTQEQHDNIEGYEILRGDNTVHKSVIANGIASDMYKYTKSNKEDWWYANFPFNDLGDDKFHVTDDRKKLIPHPFGGERNHLFSFLSPDLYLNKPSLPTEVVLQGFQKGSANQTVVNVEEHPKFTILGQKSRNLANKLATLEVALELAIKVGEAISRQWFTFGTSSGTSLGVVGSVLIGAGYAAGTAIKFGQYRYQWLKTFEDLGVSYNFAAMTVGVGEFNKFQKTEPESESYIRALTVKKYLKDGIFTTVDEKANQKINVNNDLRENSVLLSVGENFKFEYPDGYSSLDNNLRNSNSSKVIASDIGCELNLTSNRDIASPYMTLKNYIPDQWGEVDSIKWLTTNSVFKINEATKCKPIYGGTVVISPFSVRKKTPMFRATAMGLPDKLPFNYSEYNNIGKPRFYIDYKVDAQYKGVTLYPDIKSDFQFDCETGTSEMYLKPPSKIYLYSYGIVNFYVESEINCHMRYAKKEDFNWFYPQVSNVTEWVQEKNMKIAEPNTFFYNNSYSLPVSETPYRYLSRSYDKEIWRKRNLQPNGVIHSSEDRNENSLIDPWLVYQPINWYEYKTDLGKLIDLKDIESDQFLARFEDGLILQNATDKLAGKQTSDNILLGTGGAFAQRPMEYKKTDLGLYGTQHTEICSTPYGHFWVDAKRGKIHSIDQNGQNIATISERVGNTPTNMEQWFKEHLPFKILKYLPTIDVDNKFKGIGMNIWWDDRKSRVFFTKRDYIPRTKDLCSSGGKIYEASQETVDNLISENEVNGWVYMKTEDCKLVFERESSEACVENLKIIVAYRTNNQTILGGEIPPCAGGHNCNHAVFNIVGNGVQLGVANLNNSGGTYDLQGRFPDYLSGGVGYLGQAETDRYSEVNLDTATIEALLTQSSSNTLSLEFDCGCIAGDNCDTVDCHQGVGWVRVYKNGVEIYNGCPIGNIIDKLELCNEEDIRTEVKYVPLQEVQLVDDEFFKDVSWTIAFKPKEGAWSSYFSFYPDFSPSHNNFFQVGYNWKRFEGTLWNHLGNNSSFQVFQGELNPFIVEFPTQSQLVNKMFTNFEFEVETRRYQNNWDFSVWKDKGFNVFSAFTNTKHTGKLNLFPQKSLTDNRKYPKTNADNSQDILFTAENGKHNVNYFFNRVINQQRNVPMYLKDENNIFKDINPRAISFKGKSTLERMTGENIIVRLENNKESRYNVVLKYSLNNEIILP